jgi:hypothetical protein
MKTNMNFHPDNYIYQVFTTAGILLMLVFCAACSSPPTQASFSPTETAISPTQSNTPTPTAVPASPAQPEPTPSEIGPTPDGSTYTVVGVELDDVLNIREEPGVEFPITTALPPLEKNISLSGETRYMDGINWSSIEYKNHIGWVNTVFLARQYGTIPEDLHRQTRKAILALQNQDWQSLSELVDPGSCLKFSPYPYVHERDLVFCPEEIQTFDMSNQKYYWGIFDGSGKPIEMTIEDYYQRFIYDADFARPESIGFGVFLGYGNMINNLLEYYPDSAFIEYNFSEIDPQYGGMDWRSLRLVFQKNNREWTLVGIVHAEWTI